MMIVGLLDPAEAHKVAKPKDYSVNSPNGQYSLKVSSKTGEHQLYKVEQGNRAQGQLMWSFKRAVGLGSYHVSNDGRHVLWAAWEFVKQDKIDQNALTVYSKEGVELSLAYADVSKPVKYQNDIPGPRGDFWRMWRYSINVDGDQLKIAVAGAGLLILDFSGGSIDVRRLNKP